MRNRVRGGHDFVGAGVVGCVVVALAVAGAPGSQPASAWAGVGGPSSSAATPAEVSDGSRPSATSAEVGGAALAAIRVGRITGADRYEMAASVALATKPGGADVVYVASGANYPDALSAGPAAVSAHGALLLVAPDAVPAVVMDAAIRLNPRRVILVGGEISVSRAVFDEFARAMPWASVERLSGADRYAVSRGLAAQAFPRGAGSVFVATGTNFPDALSAGAPAAILSAPVLLVNGNAAAADPETQRAIAGLAPGSIAVVGGTLSVSAGVESTLSSSATVSRVGGSDRYAVSAALNEKVLADYRTVYLATGANFPDALAGAVLAGTRRNPLYVVPPTCVPRPVLDRLAALGTTDVVLLGGTTSLSPAVESLTPCP